MSYYSFAASEKEEYRGGGDPGWYTIVGHHHCKKGQPDCVSTDPRKSIKEGVPPRSPSECRPDLDKYGKARSSDCGHVGAGSGGGGTTKSHVSPLLVGAAIGIPLLIVVIALL
jgi:hypothetical protein